MIVFFSHVSADWLSVVNNFCGSCNLTFSPNFPLGGYGEDFKHCNPGQLGNMIGGVRLVGNLLMILSVA